MTKCSSPLAAFIVGGSIPPSSTISEAYCFATVLRLLRRVGNAVVREIETRVDAGEMTPSGATMSTVASRRGLSSEGWSPRSRFESGQQPFVYIRTKEVEG